MAAPAVMQRHTHITLGTPRFFVSTRGALMDRQATGAARRTGYSIESKHATRSEMQILADMLNEPAAMAEWDAGGSPDWAWAQRIAQREQAMRRGICSVASHSGEWARFVIAEVAHGA